MESNQDMVAHQVCKDAAKGQGGTHMNEGSGDYNKISKGQESGVSEND